MYSKETQRKYKLQMAAAIREKRDSLRAGELLRVVISTGNVKIGRTMNVSMAPIFTCVNCNGCKNLCYDIKSNIQYKNVVNARAKNTALAWEDMPEYFNQIEQRINRRRENKFFRWHVAGDIINMKYFENMVAIAERHPDFTFWTYTKNYNIVNLYVRMHGGDRACIPSNFSIMFSEWRGMPMFNPYGFPEFRVVFNDDEVKPVGHYCPGNCDICKANNRGCIAGETTYCHEH